MINESSVSATGGEIEALGRESAAGKFLMGNRMGGRHG
jgi:hypothetical protein